ncbi:hypothetical protein AMECASPLE_009352 [Ameca splendens]|uniref:Uncharacterized protein n=1 Tax=Ameca splendens TaxID=208324 RepID=A0ABV0Z920_9TELE
MKQTVEDIWSLKLVVKPTTVFTFCSAGFTKTSKHKKLQLLLKFKGLNEYKRLAISVHTQTHTLLLNPSSRSADETLMIMTMCNDHHFSTLMLVCSHFPPSGKEA